MRKILLIVICILLILSLAACGDNTTAPETDVPSASPALESTDDTSTNPAPADGDTQVTGGKILIAYFSSDGNIATDEEPRGNVGHGNTKTIAEMIQSEVGGDLFFIETVNKYPSNYNDTIAVAMQEQRDDARPELATHVENMDDYDVIFLGYPNWWGTLSQPVFTFLDEYDFAGKTVIPFCTHEGSGFGRSVADIEDSLPDVTLLDGFVVSGSDASDAADDVSEWLSELDLPTVSVEPPTLENVDSNILVAYFSLPETTDPNGMTKDEDNSVVVIDGEVLGNTQYVAYLIQENTGADIFRIEPKTPYPVDHDTLTELALGEQRDGARPELLTSVDNIDQYDVVLLGYPNWWADMPMILYTFLESVDLTGKTIIPFNTHGGSGFSDTIATIAELQPNATVEQNGFSVSRNTVEDCEDDVIEWLQSMNYAP